MKYSLRSLMPMKFSNMLMVAFIVTLAVSAVTTALIIGMLIVGLQSE